MRFQFILSCFCAILAGTVVGSAQTASPMKWFKPDGTNEEFQRAKGRCLAQAETAEAASTNPNGFARTATWMAVFQGCMRGEGWIYAPESGLPPGAHPIGR